MNNNNSRWERGQMAILKARIEGKHVSSQLEEAIYLKSNQIEIPIYGLVLTEPGSDSQISCFLVHGNNIDDPYVSGVSITQEQVNNASLHDEYKKNPDKISIQELKHSIYTSFISLGYNNEQCDTFIKELQIK